VMWETFFTEGISEGPRLGSSGLPGRPHGVAGGAGGRRTRHRPVRRL